MLQPPFNLNAFIATHRDQLKPPVANRVLWRDQDFICMVVGGPNQRRDYHIDEGPEFFYQLEGQMVLKTQQQGRVVDIPIAAGEVFLLPPRVPHSPQRMPVSVGLVIERARLADELDGLQWYCERCNHLLYEERFALTNIETQFAAVFARYAAHTQARHCAQCGHLNPGPT